MKRVLVADDDPYWIERVSKVVTECGHEVTTATNPRKARRFLNTQKFDLAILDNRMGVEGYLRNAGIQLLYDNYLAEKEIPSILHTSEIDAEQEKLLARTPAVILVIKGFPNEDDPLIDAIKKLLP